MHDGAILTTRIGAAKEEALRSAKESLNSEELAHAKREWLGKSSPLLRFRRELGTLPQNERRALGALLNEATEIVEGLFEERGADLAAPDAVLAQPMDTSLPPIVERVGRLHPTVQLMYDLNDAFTALNFDVFEGPELSSEKFEFDMMNFPPDHPARESMDTYWLAGSSENPTDERLCMRPHLTGASIRYMLTHEPPFRFVYPGRVYRNEAVDARHERAFFQYEVLIVDKNVSMSTGRFLVDTILDTVFGRPVDTRMRSGYFPFVEPGFEIDMVCQVCGGEGCRTCHQVGWLEVMPGGVPHPNVLRAAGLDPEIWTGFYVNVGLDRLVMMNYGIDDVRVFHGTDLAFLNQFS